MGYKKDEIKYENLLLAQKNNEGREGYLHDVKKLKNNNRKVKIYLFVDDQKYVMVHGKTI